MRQFWDKHKTITRYYETLARAVCERWRLTQMEYDVIMFLHAHPQLNTAADMVRERKLAKSHVSAALAALEKRGYVAKKRTATNKRVVELFLQDNANDVVHAGMQAHRQFVRTMIHGISKDDFAAFQRVFDAMCANAERGLREAGAGAGATDCAATRGAASCANRNAGADATANSAAHATPNTKPNHSPKDDDTCSK